MASEDWPSQEEKRARKQARIARNRQAIEAYLKNLKGVVFQWDNNGCYNVHYNNCDYTIGAYSKKMRRNGSGEWVVFPNGFYEKQTPKKQTWKKRSKLINRNDKMGFGRYATRTLAWVAANDPKYLQWCLSSVSNVKFCEWAHRLNLSKRE